MSVYQAITAVMDDLSKEGIQKDRKNSQQGYNFRGIDDVYNALSPILAKHKLCILPRIIGRTVIERETRNGGAIFYVTVEAEFDLVSAVDGSKHTIRTFGEAMDTADKATNKAQSAAYKYAAMQAFCIPTEGDNDADATTHEVKPKQIREEDTKPPKHKNYDVLLKELRLCTMPDDINRAWKDEQFVTLRKVMPEYWQAILKEEAGKIAADLKAKTEAKDTVEAVKDMFPGSDVKDERITHPLMAGE